MFANRLKLARKKAGLSLRALAGAIGHKVSANALSKYERGEMMPGSEVLIALTQALDVSLPYLLDSQALELTDVDFRKKAATNARDRAVVETEILEWVARYLQVEQILDVGSIAWSQPFRAKAIRKIDQAEQVAEAVRYAWSLGEDPIPNMTELLEERGLKVLVTELPAKVSGLTCTVRGEDIDGVPVIVVNRCFPLERRRLTLAHELAHRVVDPKYLDARQEEKAAQRFAGAFLIPRDHLEREVGAHRGALGFKELIYLKRMYRVSAAALLVRLRDVGIIDDSVLTTAFKTYASSWRETEPEPLETDSERGTREAERRFERLCYRALAERMISVPKAAELLRANVADVEVGLKGKGAGAGASHCQ